MSHIKQERALVLYNAEKQEIVGYFKTKRLVSKYIFGNENSNNALNKVCYSCQKRGTILKSILPFRCAVRFANDEQVKILGDNDYLLINGYKPPTGFLLKGFDSNRLTMAIEGKIIMKRRWS